MHVHHWQINSRDFGVCACGASHDFRVDNKKAFPKEYHEDKPPHGNYRMQRWGRDAEYYMQGRINWWDIRLD